jgi:acyl-CoA thioester hydrolase
MPITHTETFRVRYYECDAYGHLNNVNYLRYMEEAAIRASSAVGYTPSKYREMGRIWLARQTEIEYLRPLSFDDEVQIKTWVADFRGARSRRRYEFMLTGSEIPVANASTDWVFLDTQTGKPAAVPPELAAAFFPEGLPDTAISRERFPIAPPPPPKLFTIRKRVEWRDIDQANHLNNAAFLAYTEDCGLQIATAHGWQPERMNREGFAIIARRHQIEYRLPALLNEELELATWISNVRQTTAVRHYIVSRAKDLALLAQVHTLYVWVDVNTGRPVRIPKDFMTDFEANLSR